MLLVTLRCQLTLAAWLTGAGAFLTLKVFSQLLCGYFKYVKSFRFSQFEAPVYGCACVRKTGKVYKLPGGDLFGFLQVALSLLSWPRGRRQTPSDGEVGGWLFNRQLVRDTSLYLGLKRFYFVLIYTFKQCPTYLLAQRDVLICPSC